jgi:hypothetical protein
MIVYGFEPDPDTFENENIEPPEYDTVPEHGLHCEYCAAEYAYVVMEYYMMPILLCHGCATLSEDDVKYEAGQI